MNIVVTVKQVADPNIPPSHVQLDAAAKRLVTPFGIPPVMSGYDANALEAALRLREAHGGKITAISLGEAVSRDTLKRAVAMGANAAVLLSDPARLQASCSPRASKKPGRSIWCCAGVRPPIPTAARCCTGSPITSASHW